jgi:hypothetical protein
MELGCKRLATADRTILLLDNPREQYFETAMDAVFSTTVSAEQPVKNSGRNSRAIIANVNNLGNLISWLIVTGSE